MILRLLLMNLVLAGTAGAEPAPAFFEALWIANDLQKENKKLDACYQKMQAAMEAMEHHFYYKSDGRMIFPFKPDGEPIPMDVGPLITKWAEAKACWRK